MTSDTTDHPKDDATLKSQTAVVLLAHGSRDPAWLEWFQGLSSSLADSLGAGRVRAAYLQLSPPTLPEAITAAANDGFRKIAVLPIFISAGGHATRDVPQQVAAAQEQFSGMEITILPRIGQTPGFEELIRNLTIDASDCD